MIVLRLETGGYSLIGVDEGKVLFNDFFKYSFLPTEEGIEELALNVLENSKKAKGGLWLLAQEGIIIKEVEVLKNSKDKEVEKIVAKQLDISDYDINLKRVALEDPSFEKARVILYPKYYNKLLKKVAKLLKIRAKEVLADFEVLEYMNLKDAFVSIFRKEDFIFSRIEGGVVVSSIIMKKVDRSFLGYLEGNSELVFIGKPREELQKLKNTEEVGEEGFFSCISRVKKKKPEGNYSYIFNLSLCIFLIMSIGCFKKIIKKEEPPPPPPKVEKRVYGGDFKTIQRYQSFLNARIENINMEEGQTEIIFLANKEEIGGILSSKLFKKAKIESIDRLDKEDKDEKEEPKVDNIAEEVIGGGLYRVKIRI